MIMLSLLIVRTSKDQGEDLIEINLTDEGKEAHPIFLSFSIPANYDKRSTGC